MKRFLFLSVLVLAQFALKAQTITTVKTRTPALWVSPRDTASQTSADTLCLFAQPGTNKIYWRGSAGSYWKEFATVTGAGFLQVSDSSLYIKNQSILAAMNRQAGAKLWVDSLRGTHIQSNLTSIRDTSFNGTGSSDSLNKIFESPVSQYPSFDRPIPKAWNIKSGGANKDLNLWSTGTGQVNIMGGIVGMYLSSNNGPDFGGLNNGGAGWAYRPPVETMDKNFLISRFGQYLFEDESANWYLSLTPTGIRTGPHIDNLRPVNGYGSLEIWGKQVIGKDYIGTVVAPDNGLQVEGRVSIGSITNVGQKVTVEGSLKLTDSLVMSLNKPIVSNGGRIMTNNGSYYFGDIDGISPSGAINLMWNGNSFLSHNNGVGIYTGALSVTGNISASTLTLTGISSGSAGDFVVNSGGGKLFTRSAAQVLTDIGAASSTTAITSITGANGVSVTGTTSKLIGLTDITPNSVVTSANATVTGNMVIVGDAIVKSGKSLTVQAATGTDYGIRWNYNASNGAASRLWVSSSDVLAAGDWSLAQMTTQGGTTPSNALYFDPSKNATFSGTVSGSSFNVVNSGTITAQTTTQNVCTYTTAADGFYIVGGATRQTAGTGIYNLVVSWTDPYGGTNNQTLSSNGAGTTVASYPAQAQTFYVGSGTTITISVSVLSGTPTYNASGFIQRIK